MPTNTPVIPPPKPSLNLNLGRVREVAAHELIDELNRVVDHHNRMAVDFLRCLIWLSQQLAISQEKAGQSDILLEENNRLLYLAQQTQMLQAENEHLWYVIADLEAELRQFEGADGG